MASGTYMSRDFFALNQLDYYVFCDLLAWLPFPCIVNLRQTGDKALRRLLQSPGAVRRMTVVSYRFTKVLESLYTRDALNGGIAGVDGIVSRKEHVIRNPPSICVNLSHVTHLKLILDQYCSLREERKACVPPFIASLPSLTHLVHPMYYNDPMPFVKSLPAQLRHLSIGDINEKHIHAFVRSLPRSIEFLSMEPHSFPDECVQDLPPNLTALVYMSWIGVTSITLSLLPRSIVHLALRRVEHHVSYEERVDSATLSCLPPNLVHLAFAAIDDRLSDDAVHALPPSLQYLAMLANTTLTNHGIASLPRNLTFLGLNSNKLISGACFQHLPPSLTRLDVSKANSVKDDDIVHLPSTLTHLEMYDSSVDLTDKGIAHMPRKLRFLSIACTRNITDACIKSLPPRLEYLDVFNAYLLTDDFWLDMPPTIAKIVIPPQLVYGK